MTAADTFTERVQSFAAGVADRLASLASHRSILARHRYLIGLNPQKRAEMYAAAKTTRLTGAWTVINPNVNDIIGLSAPAVRARVRQLIRDFPYLARAANVMVDYSIGAGIMFQSKAKDVHGKPDKKRIQEIEDAVAWWMDEADIAGKLHFHDIIRLTKRQDLEAGEFLVAKVYPKDSNRYLPFALQVYEADWLTSAHDNYGSGGIGISAPPGVKETRQGIEYEKLTGRVTGYWFMDPYYGGNEVRIDASQVLHGFDMLRPQQLRGISPFAPGVLLAQSLSEYMGSEIDTANMASKWLAKVRRNNPSAIQGLSGFTSEMTASGNTAKVEELENCIIEYLQSGEDIEIMHHNRPGTTFAPFVRLILTMLSITTGAPYELISGDYSGLNFSTARIVRNDFSQQLRPITVRHIRQIAAPAVNAAIAAAVLAGKISPPGYWMNPRRYHEAEWQPPGMEAVDPLREAKSQIEAISNGLKSPQEVARERGRDLADIYREIKQAQELAEEIGVEFRPVETPEKNNPAAVAKEEEE